MAQKNTPRPNLPMRKRLQSLEGPLLLLVWGFAIGVLMWGSGLDVAIQVWLFENYVQKFNTVMRVLGSMGKGTFQVGLCLLVGGTWALLNWRRGRLDVCRSHYVLLTVPVFTLAGAVNWVMKWSIGRGRPKEFLWNGTSPYQMNSFEGSAQWWSFPSGHSCSTFAIAVWLGLAFPRWRCVFWGIAGVLSFSRFLSVTPHYAGDVVAGAAVGAAVAWAVWIVTFQDAYRKDKRHG